MFINSRVVLAGIGFLILAAPSRASVLSFDSCGTSGTSAILNTCSGGIVNQNYGDRVTGTNTDANGTQDRSYGNSGEGFTPNILVNYSAGAGWGTGFSTLTNVLYLPVDTLTNPNNVLDITFTADSGYIPRLLGFSLGAFFDTFNQPNITSYSGVGVSVFTEGNVTLFSQSYTVDSNTTNQSFDLAGNAGGSLTLRLNLNSLAYDPNILRFDRESVGIDNIRFAQQTATTSESVNESIPEPTTFALVGGAALVGCFIRRRR